jgi:deazaflavin-dependent oxidoreductase (nitroreductase family)
MSDEHFLYLETRGRNSGLPRRIEIWFVEHESRWFIVAEQRGRANWLRNLQADPHVRFSIGARDAPELARSLTPARARVLDEQRDAPLAAAVRARMDAKYDWSAGWIVELAPEPAR